MDKAFFFGALKKIRLNINGIMIAPTIARNN
jgi:hypothetical protein